MAVDRIRPMKLESPATGGTQDDAFPTEADPNEDYPDVRGVTFQNDSSNDEDVIVSRDASDNLTFIDKVIEDEVSLERLKRAYSQSTGEPTGFPDRTLSTISFVDASRTFTIEPVSSDFIYFLSGVMYEITSAKTVVISNVEGFHYIYFDGDVLVETTIFDPAIIYSYAYVAVIYWSVSMAEAIYIGDERHGITMDGETHIHFHLSMGTSWISGLDLTGILADEDGSSDTHAQLGYATGVIRDEDLRHSIAVDAAPAQIPVFYFSGSGADWLRYTPTNFPLRIYGGGGGNRPAFNEWTGSTWQQTEVPDENYMLMHLFATNDIDYPVIAIQGRNSYIAYFSAQFGAASELDEIIGDGFPFAETTPLGSVLFECDDSYTNSVNARIVSIAGKDYVDWRGVQRASIGIAAEGVKPFGTQLAYDSDATTSSTTSTTYQQKLRLDLGGLPEGTYRVGFQTEWQYSSTARSISIRLEADDTTTVVELSIEPKDPADWNTVTGFYFVTLSEGDHFIDIDWKSEKNTETSKLRNTRIEFWRVG